VQFGLVESVRHWARYRRSSVALVEDGVEISYSELNDRVNRIASLILGGCVHGDRIAIALKSKGATIAALLAVLRVGRSAVLLHGGLPEEVLRTNLSDTQPSALICDRSYPYVDVMTAITGGPALNIEQELQLPPIPTDDILLPPTTSPDQEWGIVFSSGTTGPPKAIERDHYSMITETLGWCLELELHRKTAFYVGRPVFYTGGLVLAIATLTAGGCVVFDNYCIDESADEVWNRFQTAALERDLQWAFFVPDQIRNFTRTALSSPPRARAENLLVMGAPITGGEKVQAWRTLGSLIVESWGNSESLGTITDAEDLTRRPNSIGRPFLTDELCIVDEDGKALQPGQVGRLAGSVEAGFIGYSNRPEETRLVRRHDLIISDDLGYVDEEGFFYVLGRSQQSLIVRGRSVVLPAIENKIRQLNFVRDCAVVAIVPSGEPILRAAICVTVDSPPEFELLDVINRTLESSEALDKMVVLENLPRLPVGKVDRLKVEELVGD